MSSEFHSAETSLANLWQSQANERQARAASVIQATPHPFVPPTPTALIQPPAPIAAVRLPELAHAPAFVVEHAPVPEATEYGYDAHELEAPMPLGEGTDPIDETVAAEGLAAFHQTVAVIEWARRVGERSAAASRERHEQAMRMPVRAREPAPLTVQPTQVVPVMPSIVVQSQRAHDADEAYAAEVEPAEPVHLLDVVARRAEERQHRRRPEEEADHGRPLLGGLEPREDHATMPKHVNVRA